jgi:hypothetical protein
MSNFSQLKNNLDNLAKLAFPTIASIATLTSCTDLSTTSFPTNPERGLLSSVEDKTIIYGSKMTATSYNSIPLKGGIVVAMYGTAPKDGVLDDKSLFAGFPKIDLSTPQNPDGRYDRKARTWPVDDKYYTSGNGGTVRAQIVRISSASKGEKRVVLGYSEISPREEWENIIKLGSKKYIFRPRPIVLTNSDLKIKKGDTIALEYMNISPNPNKDYSSINVLINRGSDPYLENNQEVFATKALLNGSNPNNISPDTAKGNLAPLGFFSYTGNDGKRISIGSSYTWSEVAYLTENGTIVYPGGNEWQPNLKKLDNLKIGLMEGRNYEYLQKIVATPSRENPLTPEKNTVTAFTMPVIRNEGSGSLEIKIMDSQNKIISEARFSGNEHDKSKETHSKPQLSDSGKKKWAVAKLSKEFKLLAGQEYYIRVSSPDKNTSFTINLLNDASKYNGWPIDPELTDGGSNSYVQYRTVVPNKRQNTWLFISPRDQNMDMAYGLIMK